MTPPDMNEHDKAVIEMARQAGVFDAYYEQSLSELRAALVRFHAACVLNNDHNQGNKADSP